MANSNVMCNLSSSFLSFDNVSRYLTYTILPPICFTLGLSGHLTALFAFYKQSKTESAYAYQSFVTVMKTLDILAFNLFVLFMFHFADQNWAGQKGDNGWPWFKSQYALMWFTSHVAPILQCACLSTSILATTAMAVDRVFGLARPLAYQIIDKKKHQTIAFIFCILIGFLLAIDTGFRWTIITGLDGGYKIVGTFFGKTTAGVASSQLRNALRFVTESILVVSSLSIIFLYRKRMAKVAALTGQKSDEKEAERKTIQTALVVLALFQSISTISGTVYLSTYSYASYFLPTFAKCRGQIFPTIFDFAKQLIDALDFYFLFAVSRPFRTVIKSLR